MRWALLLVAACGNAHVTNDLVITDVTVVAMTSDEEVAHRTVAVRGGTIVDIVPASEHVTGTTVIDGRGKWLMPGLADMHVHTWKPTDMTLFVAAGVTTIRNMWGTPWHLTMREQISRGVLGPTIVTAGNLIDGPAAAWVGSYELVNPADADALVTAEKAAGYDFVKVVNKLSPAAYEALARAAAANQREVEGHVPWQGTLDDVLAMKQHSVEHLDGVLDKLVADPAKLPAAEDDAWVPAITGGADIARLPALYPKFQAAGTWNCPTLVANEATPELGSADDFENATRWLPLVSPAQRALWRHGFATRELTAEQNAQMARLVKLYGQVAAAMVIADQRILVGTDAGGPYDIAGVSLHQEIEKLVAYGAPRAKVMRAATAGAWQYLNEMRGFQPQHRGVIERGAIADLLVVAVDPMTTPLPLVPDAVIVKGVAHPKAELDGKLADLTRAVAAAVAVPAGMTLDLVDGTPVGAYSATRTIDFATGLVTELVVTADAVDVVADFRGMHEHLHAEHGQITGTLFSGQRVTATASGSIDKVRDAVLGYARLALRGHVYVDQ